MRAGVLAATVEYLADPTGFIDRRTTLSPGFFRAETLPYGPEIFVTNPALARLVFASSALHGGLANQAHRLAVGDLSVSSLDGPAHQERRRLLGPVLLAGRSALTTEVSRARMVRALAAAAPTRKLVIDPLVRAVVMEAMLEASFGVLDAERRALGAAFAALVDLGAQRFAQLGMLPALQRDLPGSPFWLFRRRLGAIDRALYREIERPERQRGGMLAALCAARDEAGRPLSRRAIRDDLFTLLGAGYETTATSILWALCHVQRDRRAAEAIQHGDDGCLDTAIRESLRLRPTLPTVRRVAVAPCRFETLSVLAGESVVLAIHALHRDPGSWTDASAFDRRRADGHGAFFAFGGGARVCPGAPLALAHMRGVLSALVAHVEAAEGGGCEPVFRGATLAPAQPIEVRLRRR